MKKFLSLALALLLLLSVCLFGACNPTNTPVEPNNPSTPTEPTDPNTPSTPTDPNTPSNPTEPTEPTDPNTPSNPSEPTEPTEPDDGWVSAIFGGGPFVNGADFGLDVVSETMKNSGFDTMIIWSVHVHRDDTLFLNDIKVCDKGELVIADETVKMWSEIKKGESNIRRVEISVGAYGCEDFEAIKEYIERDGTDANTMLYRNFAALIEATGADAVNFDDESCYDVGSATEFGKMCGEMGCKVALCPYTNINFWSKVKENLGDLVDRVYLQCYEGGSSNTPKTWSTWSERLGGMKLIPGYFGGTTSGRSVARAVKNSLRSNTEFITGGFMWLFDDIMKLDSPNSVSDYASAIESANPNKE